MKKKDYKEQCAVYRQSLQENIRIISCLDKEQYPNLHLRLRAHGAGEKLLNLMREGTEKSGYPGVTRRVKDIVHADDGSVLVRHFPEEIWFSTSLRFLAGKYGGAIRTWCNVFALFAAWGLIVKHRPDRNAVLPRKMDIYAFARAQNRQSRKRAQGNEAVSEFVPETFYYVPSYTENLLGIAEERAKIWNEKEGKMSSISKNALTAMYGQTIADAAYDDGRVMSRETAKASHALSSSLADLILTKGYALPLKVISHARGDKALLRRVWKQLGQTIVREQGLRYGRPNKEEKLRWKLKGDSYIIR